MKDNKVRNSSLDILRIISMFLIIAHHWEIHGNGDQILFSCLDVKQAYTLVIGSWGTLGVNIFFMISAYFLIKDNNVKTERIVSMVLKCSIYGTIVVLIAIGANVIPFNISVLIRSILGIAGYQYWFFVVYIVVYLLHPVLNLVIDSVNGKELRKLICILLCSVYYLGFVWMNEFVGRLACGVTIYLLIGYIEKEKIQPIQMTKLHLALISMVVLIFLEMGISATLNGGGTGLGGSIIKRIQTTQSPFMLICSILIFYAVKNIYINQSKFVELIGKYSTGAYLLHGGAGFIKGFLWDDLLNAGFLYINGTVFGYIFHYIGSVFAILMLGVFAEFLYTNTVDKVIIKAFRRFKINSWSGLQIKF